MDEEVTEGYNRLKKIEEEGHKNLLKHFDRIHDKLFSFNNILIAGYFSLSKIFNSISAVTILIPLANLFLLLVIEYKMMQKSRFESQVTKRPMDEITAWKKGVDITTTYSLLAWITTTIVTCIFVSYLL